MRVLVTFLLGLLAALGAATAAAQGDAVLRDAHKAWKGKDFARLSAITAQAKDHVLAPYFEYWLVDLAPGDEAIKRYLDKHPGTALSERLRADWIRGLGRRGDWTQIVTEAPKLAARENDILCWSLRARWEQGDKLAAAELIAQFNAPRDLHDPCVTLADGLVKAGLVSNEQIWTRARRLVEAGHPQAARRTLRWLKESPPAALADSALGTPDRMLTRVQYDLRRPLDREMVAFGLVRVANDDADRAYSYYEKIAGKLTPEQRSWVLGHLGLVSSRRAQARALDWYRGATHAKLSDEHYAWWARAAMRAGNWEQLHVALTRMSEASRAEPVWTYWLGRAESELGFVQRARPLLAQAANDHGFYGLLASDALGWRVMPAVPATPATAAERAQVATHPGLQRAAALMRNDMRLEGMREWDFTVARWNDKQLIAAAKHAEHLGMWDRVVETSDRTTRLLDVATRYATPYLQPVRHAALSAAIDPALIYAIMRQESRFFSSARSRVGAAGLMQVMPATGDAVAQAAGLHSHSAARMLEPAHNILVGGRYLRSLLDDLGGSPIMAFAGYNAGPGRALMWRGPRPMEAAAYAESIPFDETRDYVKRVAANAHYYRKNLHGETPQLSAWLGRVPGVRPEGAPPAGLERVAQR